MGSAKMVVIGASEISNLGYSLTNLLMSRKLLPFVKVIQLKIGFIGEKLKLHKLEKKKKILNSKRIS